MATVWICYDPTTADKDGIKPSSMHPPSGGGTEHGRVENIPMSEESQPNTLDNNNSSLVSLQLTKQRIRRATNVQSRPASTTTPRACK